MAGGGRYPCDNLLYGRFFYARNNFADVVLVMRVNIGLDGDGIRDGGDYGHNLRGDSKQFGRSDLADGRRNIIGLLFRRQMFSYVDKRVTRGDVDAHRHF